MDGSYRALLEPRTAQVREKGSRFLAVLEPVADESDGRAVREKLASKHRDASHHCWAERIGWPPRERLSDAGEPRGTAGEPIARVLRARELSDIVVVVVRWFGGVKLGKGGLARAYAGVVAAALECARFDRRFPMTSVRLRIPYERVGAVQHLARIHQAEWSNERFGTDVQATLRMRADVEEEVRSGLANLRVLVDREAEYRS